MDPDPDTGDPSEQLAAGIYQGYLQQAFGQLAASRWEDALDPLMKARNLCQDLNGLRCDNRLDSAFARLEVVCIARCWIRRVAITRPVTSMARNVDSCCH